MQKHHKRFSNQNPAIKPKGLLALLKWKLHAPKSLWPRSVQKLEQTDLPPSTIQGDTIRISYVGHVSFLIQTLNLNILTDPVWSNCAGPFGILGPKRVVEPGIKFEDLPKINIIVISHNHYDHMDIPTLRRLWKRDKPIIIAPLENDKILKNAIPDIEIHTLNWSEHITIQDATTIYLEPAQHWSARGIFDRNKALWGTFILSTPKGSLCFIGDTGYDPELFKHISKKHPNILVSLIPIGAFEPRWFMKDVHINPEEAVLVYQDLGSTYAIASHFNTFDLADDAYGQAGSALEQAREKYGIKSDHFILPHPGKTYLF